MTGKTVDAVVTIAAPGGAQAAGIVRAVARAGRGKLNVIAFDGADALAQKVAGLAAAEIPAGSFGGAPPRPTIP